MTAAAALVDIRRVFPWVAVAVLATQVGMGIISPILPIYAKDLGATGLWIGIIAAGYSISRAVFMAPFGWLSDRRGRKAILAAGLFTSAGLSFAYIYAGSVEWLTLVRGFHGLFSAMVIPIATAYVGELSPEGEEGKWMGYFNTAFFVGFGVGPLLGGLVADRLGTAAAFNAMGALNLISFLTVVFFLPEATVRKARRKVEVSYRRMFGSGVVRGLFAYRFIFELAMSAVMSFLPVYVGVTLGMDKTMIGALIAVHLLVMSFLQVYTGVLSDRMGRRGMIMGGSLTTFALLATMTLTGNFWVLLGIMALRAVSSSFTMPAISAISVEEGRRFGMGSTTSILGVATSAGMAVGPVLAGLVADAANVPAIFYLSAAVGLLGTALFAWFSRGYRQTVPSPARAAARSPE